MGKPIIFLGPSLSHEKARKIFDADYRPPARKGDFLRLAAADFDVVEMAIGFVDGVFLQDYPPTPIEVYHLARKNGVLLVGAASLGALRAVELEKFGMVGIGKIFQLYKTGKVNADDEVAVTFASEGDYQLQSEAMIDIRYNLYLAHKKGVINEKAKSVLVRLAKEIYFPHRKYTYILEEARNRYPMLESEINSFGSYIRSNRKSLKEMDAIRLVKYLKERYESTNTISTR
ncbi:MAG: TfuA-like protein [Thermoproteota archaeon]|nr:TfuA-like protein [Thermoproteota archaeon]